MLLSRRQWTFLGAGVVVLGIPGAWLLARSPGDADAAVVAQTKRGEFKVIVTTSGELRAIKFVQINVPQNAQQANQYQMKISSIVPEGTVVKEGDIVAELDRSGIASRASDVSLALQKAQAVYEQAMLDSTLNLSKAREDMRTMELTLEEKKLAKEQSVFEAPTVRRQAEIDLEKAQRALAQAKLDYKTRTEQAEAKMREVGADRDRQKNLLAVVQDVMANFTIRAPARPPPRIGHPAEGRGRHRRHRTPHSRSDGSSEEALSVRFDRESLARLRGQITAHVLFSMRTALEAVEHNKLRASLTSLGILFGVASVIAMLAIGTGAEAEIMAQMRLLGSNNVMIVPLVEQKEGPATEQDNKAVKKFSPGLTYADAQAIARVVPSVEVASAEIVLNSSITREGHRRSGKLVGVDTSYFRLTNLDLGSGAWFTSLQVAQGLPVAIIGNGVRTRFFTTENPIGKPIKVGETWLTVVGVLMDRRVSNETAARLGIRDANMDVYIPVHTMLLRFRNRAQLTQRDIELASRPGQFVTADSSEFDKKRAERTNRNQLDRIIVRVADSRLVPKVAEVTQRRRSLRRPPALPGTPQSGALRQGRYGGCQTI